MQTTDSVFRKPLEAALENAMAHLESLDRTPVAATVDLATLRNRIGRALQDDGVAPEQVVADLVKDVEGGILGSAGGRFFGSLLRRSAPAALAADWLTSTYDRNSRPHSCRA